MSKETKPSLETLLTKLKEARENFKHTLATTGPGESVGTDPSIAIRKQIEENYPMYFKNLEECEVLDAIQLLKSKGYKIMKPEVKTEYIEL